MGIEPTYPAWKAGVLPLNYTRSYEIINLHPSMRAIDGARTRGLDLGKVARYPETRIKTNNCLKTGAYITIFVDFRRRNSFE